MSEEKRKILEMLEAGAITQEDARRLLDALGEETEPVPAEEPPAEGAADEGSSAGLPTLTLYPEGFPEIPEIPEIPEVPEIPEPPENRGEPGHRGEVTLGEEIESVEIDWVAGPIEIRPYHGDTVQVTEFAKRPLADSERMAVTLRDETLQVHWCSKRSFLNALRPLSKRLLVEIPASLEVVEELKVKTASGGVLVTGLRLEDADISAASGGAELQDLQAENLTVSTASGGIAARNIRGEDVKLSTASGGIRAEKITGEEVVLSAASGKITALDVNGETISVSAASGGLEISGFTGEEVKLSAVSGGLRARGTGEDLKVRAVSGKMELALEELPESLRAESTSGGMQVTLPDRQKGFTVQYESMSGGFRSDFALTGKLEKRSGRGVYGQGETEIRLHTLSGEMRLCRSGRE